MVGLGNSRRGMKSPPLLVTALVACVIVLGFNYWIASSRGVDLQNRIMELESRVRRAAAERGAVELKKNEFQGELKKQREQIDKIQSLHNFQLESTNKMHRDEKAILLNNITIYQEHLKELQKEYGKLQMDVFRFQKNQTNLQKKLTYDMNQCFSQMKELKEQCEETIEEISKKGSETPQEKEKKRISDISEKNYQVNIQMPTFGPSESQYNDLTKQRSEPQENLHISDDSLQLEASKPAPIIKNVAELDYHRTKGTDDIVAISEEELQKEEHPIEKDHLQIPSKPSTDHKELPRDPGIEQNPYEGIRNVLEEATVEKQTGKFPGPAGQQNTYQAKADDEEIEREQLLNDDLQQDDQETSKGGEFEIKRVNQDNKGVDYNLDMNEAESETDKQAALVNHEINFNAQNLEDPNMQNHLFKLGEEHQQKL